MAADLHIHIYEGITENDLARFFSHVLGSKYFNMFTRNRAEGDYKAGETPGVWIGEVSWLKAALFEDAENYIPSPVQIINDLIGEDLPVLDEDLLGKILAALEQPNSTQYCIAEPKQVELFLRQHMGKRLFTISW